MANMITKRLSLLQCVNIVSEDLNFDERNEMWTRGQRWLTDNRIKAFYTISRSDKYKEGVRYEFTKKLIHKIETSSKRSPSVVRASNSWKPNNDQGRRFEPGLCHLFLCIPSQINSKVWKRAIIRGKLYDRVESQTSIFRREVRDNRLFILTKIELKLSFEEAFLRQSFVCGEKGWWLIQYKEPCIMWNKIA